MIGYFKNTRIDFLDGFNFFCNSIYISPNSDSAGSSKGFNYATNYLSSAGQVLYSATSVDHLEKNLEKKETTLYNILTRSYPKPAGSIYEPYTNTLNIYADQDAYLELLVKFFKTAYKNASDDFLWMLIGRLKQYYKRETHAERSKDRWKNLDISRETFNKYLDKVTAYKVDSVFSNLPLEYQVASFYYNKEKVIKEPSFIKNIHEGVEFTRYKAVCNVAERFARILPFIHEYYPEYFGDEKGYDMEEKKLMNKLQEIWKGNADFIFLMDHNQTLDSQKRSTNHLNMKEIHRGCHDFMLRGDGYFRTKLDLSHIEFTENTLHSKYVELSGNIETEEIIKLIEKYPQFMFFLIETAGYYHPFMLSETMSRQDDKEFLRNLYVE